MWGRQLLARSLSTFTLRNAAALARHNLSRGRLSGLHGDILDLRSLSDALYNLKHTGLPLTENSYVVRCGCSVCSSSHHPDSILYQAAKHRADSLPKPVLGEVSPIVDVHGSDDVAGLAGWLERRMASNRKTVVFLSELKRFRVNQGKFSDFESVAIPRTAL